MNICYLCIFNGHLLVFCYLRPKTSKYWYVFSKKKSKSIIWIKLGDQDIYKSYKLLELDQSNYEHLESFTKFLCSRGPV